MEGKVAHCRAPLPSRTLQGGKLVADQRDVGLPRELPREPACASRGELPEAEEGGSFAPLRLPRSSTQTSTLKSPESWRS
eukprot:14958622-Alexandrium_andersonii.AAC.1